MKLLAALPAPLAAEAETITDWFLHDLDCGDGRTPPHGELRRIASNMIDDATVHRSGSFRRVRLLAAMARRVKMRALQSKG